MPSSTQDAYDVVFTDTLPAQLQFVSGTQLSGPVPDTLTMGAAFSAAYNIFATGDTAVFSITAKLDPAITANTSIANTAEADWSNAAGTLSGERTDSGGVDDYTEDDMLTTLFSFEMDIAKGVTDTNVSSSSGAQVVIGEEVEYTVTLSIPEESGFADSVLSDSLPSGMEVLRIDSILTSPSVNYTTSTSVISGNALSIDFGTISNTDTTSSTTETLTVVYTARVINENVNDQGDDLTNFATIDRTG